MKRWLTFFRVFGVGMVLICSLMLLTCAPAKSEWSLKKAAEPYRGVTLRAIFEPWAGMKAYEEIAKDFKKITGISIKVEYADYTERVAKNRADLIAGTRIYDFGLVSWQEIGFNVENGWLVLVDEYLNDPKLRDPDHDPSEWMRAGFFDSTTKWNEKYYGLPMFQNFALEVYRKDIAENPIEKAAFKKKYGYDLHFPPDNYDQYYDYCEFFTRKKGDMLMGEVLERDFYGTTVAFKRHVATPSYFRVFLAPFGAWYYDNEGHPTVNSPEAVAALEFLLSLRKFSPPGVTEFTWDEQFSTMAAGNAFIFNTTPDTFAYLEDPEASTQVGNFGYFLMPPVKPGIPSAYSNPAAWGIWSTAKHREAAWLFVQYCQSYGVQKKYQKTGGITFRLDVMKDPEIYNSFPWMPATVKMFETPGTIMNITVGWPWYVEGMDLTAEYLSKAGAGEYSAKECLDLLQAELEKIARPRK